MDGETRRLVLYGLACLWLSTAALTGRSRKALWDYASSHIHAPAGIATRVAAPSGIWLPGLDLADVEVAVRGGTLNAIPAFPVSRGARITAKTRRLRLSMEDATLLGVAGCRFRVCWPSAKVDGLRLAAHGALAVVSSGPGEAVLEAPAWAMEEVVRRRLPEIREVRVIFVGDSVCISGEDGLGAPLSAAARLEIHGGRDLALTEAQAWRAGERLPDVLVSLLLRRLNPVLSLQDVPGAAEQLQLQRIAIRDGVLRLFVTVRPLGRSNSR